MKCVFAWGGVYIEGNGDVRPCCAFINHGNLSDEGSLAEIFSGEKANNLRRLMSEDRIDELPPACPNCINLMRRPTAGEDWFKLMGDRDEVSSEFHDNGASVKEAFYTGQQLVPGTAPLQMVVQLGELCNIACIMCPQDHMSKMRLNPAQIAKIKEALPYINYITLSGGEPLVFPEAWDILNEYQKYPQPKRVTILSNGKLLRPERLRKFMAIDSMNFAINIDAATKATYEKIRVGGNWDVLMRNIKDYVAFIKTEKPRWALSCGFTIMHSNFAEIRQAIDLVHEIGGGGISFGPMTGDYHPAKNCRTYLQENIFCFPHLGFTREQLRDELMELSTYARSKGETWQETGDTLAGVANYAMSVRQVEFPTDDILAAQALGDENLSSWMQRNVTTGPFRLAAMVAEIQAKAKTDAEWNRDRIAYLEDCCVKQNAAIAWQKEKLDIPPILSAKKQKISRAMKWLMSWRRSAVPHSGLSFRSSR